MGQKPSLHLSEKIKGYETTKYILQDSVKVLDLSLHLCDLMGNRDIKILSVSRDFFSSRTLIFYFGGIAPDANDMINLY